MPIIEPDQKETTSFEVVNPNKTTVATIASSIGLKDYVCRLCFPGSVAGQLKYENLGRNGKVMTRDAQTLTSSIGSKVGIHIYEPEQEKATDVVVIFFHGNIRPTRYNPDILQSFLDCGATVIGRDFPGYDQSSYVPNTTGSMELAMIANDEEVMKWVLENYKTSRILLCGRSIGTFSWANQLSHPRVIGAIGLVPFLALTSLVRPALKKGLISEGILNTMPILRMPEKFESVTSATFPAGCYSEKMERVRTTGFQITGFGAGVDGKHVALFPATKDEDVPQGAAEELKQILEKANVNVNLEWLEGDHKALPTTEQYQEALHWILR